MDEKKVQVDFVDDAFFYSIGILPFSASNVPNPTFTTEVVYLLD